MLMIRDKLDWDFDYLTGAQLSQFNGGKDGHVSLQFYAAGLRQASGTSVLKRARAIFGCGPKGVKV